MAKHLFLLKDEKLANSSPVYLETNPTGKDSYEEPSGDSPFYFGINPTKKGSYDEFFALKRKISLKNDLKWREVQDLQAMFRGAGIWNDFPAEGLKFICAESPLGDENQRIDILYLRDDGGLYICELKIGGESFDVHGQLIRYIADLHYQTINTQWICEKRIKYLGSDKQHYPIVPTPTEDEDTSVQQSHEIAKEKLTDFFVEKGITDRHTHLIKNAGIIVDEDFKDQTVLAVRYLNEVCGFSIRLLRLDAFVAEDWSFNQPMFRVRIDVVEVQ